MVSPPSCSCSSSQPSVDLLGTHFASACPATSISAAMIAAPPPSPRSSASCSAECLLKILVEFAKKLLRCQPRRIGTDQQRQILGHVAGLDGVDADALEGARESCDLGRVVELGTVFEAAGDRKSTRLNSSH